MSGGCASSQPGMVTAAEGTREQRPHPRPRQTCRSSCSCRRLAWVPHLPCPCHPPSCSVPAACPGSLELCAEVSLGGEGLLMASQGRFAVSV